MDLKPLIVEPLVRYSQELFKATGMRPQIEIGIARPVFHQLYQELDPVLHPTERPPSRLIIHPYITIVSEPE